MKSKTWFALLVIAGFLLVFSSCASIGGKAIKDIDGNSYTSVIIGDQEWLRENLRTTRYNDGTPIPNVVSTEEWVNTESPAYVWYEHDISNKVPFGALYNWYAVGSRPDLCPAGWRVATDDDWKTLEAFLGMTPEEIEGTGMRGTIEGGKLKEAGTDNWYEPNEGATNEYGFTALPSGRRRANGSFVGMEQRIQGSTIWTYTGTSAETAYYRHLAIRSARIGRNPEGEKKMGLAVRCIRE